MSPSADATGRALALAHAAEATDLEYCAPRHDQDECRRLALREGERGGDVRASAPTGSPSRSGQLSIFTGRRETAA